MWHVDGHSTTVLRPVIVSSSSRLPMRCFPDMIQPDCSCITRVMAAQPHPETERDLGTDNLGLSIWSPNLAQTSAAARIPLNRDCSAGISHPDRRAASRRQTGCCSSDRSLAGFQFGQIAARFDQARFCHVIRALHKRQCNPVSTQFSAKARSAPIFLIFF